MGKHVNRRPLNKDKWKTVVYKTEFTIWSGMKQRCCNPKSVNYHNYGARGITVSEEWQRSFDTFLNDMGPRPPHLTLDRINNNLGYCKENCRWATRKVQAFNSRDRFDQLVVEYGNQKRSIQEWSDLTGIKYTTLRNRIYNLKWPIEKALTKGSLLAN